MTYLIIEETSDKGLSPKTLYIIDADKQQNELEFEYGKYIRNIMSEHKIDVNPFFVNLLNGRPNIHDLNLHAKLLNKYTFDKWLQNEYVVEKVPFITHYSNKIKTKKKRRL